MARRFKLLSRDFVAVFTELDFSDTLFLHFLAVPGSLWKTSDNSPSAGILWVRTPHFFLSLPHSLSPDRRRK